MRTRVCALIRRADHVLLVRDRDDAFYTLPGGSIEEEEFADAALRRELREEIGAAAASIGPLRLVCENLFRWRGARYQEIVLLFEAALDPGDAPLRPGEFALCEPHLLFRWAPRDALGGLDIRPAPVVAIACEDAGGGGAIHHRRVLAADF